MFKTLIDFANELKKSSDFKKHFIVYQSLIATLRQEEVDLLKKSCPNFPNVLGYVSSVEVLRANQNRSDLPLILKLEIDKILSYKSLDDFLESCKIISKILDELFLEVFGVIQRTNKCIQILSPKGRRLLYELQCIMHRRGVARSFFQAVTPFQGSIPAEVLKFEQLTNRDKYFFPTKKKLRKEISTLSGNKAELKNILQFFLYFISFKKIFLDLLYELVMDNVPFITRGSFYKINEKSLGNITIFKGATTLPIFIIPNINYYMFKDKADCITDLLIIAGKRISFNPDETNITLRGLIINSSFSFFKDSQNSAHKLKIGTQWGDEGKDKNQSI